MTRETTYDDVHDAQRHFRSVLDSMARPGRINRLHPVALTPPAGLHTGTAYLAFALLNADVSFQLALPAEAIETYLRANTGSRPAAPSEADFIVMSGHGDAALINTAKPGIPSYPETSATALIQVEQLGKSSATGGLQLTLEGPGIEHREIVFVTGLNARLLEARKTRNTEFPLGVDFVLISNDECVLCLPRTTRVEWQTL